MNYTDIRKMFAKNDDARDIGLTTPDDIIRYNDIPYGTHGKWNLLDVYRPKKAGNATLPVIVSVHGGGWVYGDKERYQFYCMDLARRGFAVVNFSYRLAPEDRFPAAMEDVNSLFWWLLDHRSEYQMDLDRLFTVGDSAGGQLSSQYFLCSLTRLMPLCTVSLFQRGKSKSEERHSTAPSINLRWRKTKTLCL